MARATTKTDLMTAAQEQFSKLWELIEDMSEIQQEATFSAEMARAGKESHWVRDKNLRDVLVHLYEWHQLLLQWVGANRKGESRPFLPQPYNWKTYPSMNIMLWEKHQATPLAAAKQMLRDSHRAVMQLIDTFSNEELFARNRLKWTGNSPLGAYCVSVTASHYDWAMKKIRKHKKTCGA